MLREFFPEPGQRYTLELFNVDQITDDQIIALSRDLGAEAEQGNDPTATLRLEQLRYETSTLVTTDPERAHGLMERCHDSEMDADRELAAELGVSFYMSRMIHDMPKAAHDLWGHTRDQN